MHPKLAIIVIEDLDGIVMDYLLNMKLIKNLISKEKKITPRLVLLITIKNVEALL
jgi:ribosomal protein S18